MRERVDLNSNGLSIESTAKLYKKNKWISRYIVCKKPVDLRTPVFVVYKSKSARNKNQVKATFALQNYVGFESGFELQSAFNTLALITREEIIILSFRLPENLVIWETWLRNTCGQNTCFYMQLQQCPSTVDHSLLLKEVRLHLHDRRLALIHGRPQVLLEYCDLEELWIHHMADNTLSFTIRNRYPVEERFTFTCGKLDHFQKLLEKASSQNELHAYLSKQSCDGGEWLPSIRSAKSYFDCNSLISAEIVSYTENSPNSRIRSRSKSGYTLGSNTSMRLPSNSLVRANSVVHHNTIFEPGRSAYQNNTFASRGMSRSSTVLPIEHASTSKPRQQPTAISVHNMNDLNYCNMTSDDCPEDVRGPPIDAQVIISPPPFQKTEMKLPPVETVFAMADYVNVDPNHPDGPPYAHVEEVSRRGGSTRRKSDNLISQQFSRTPSKSRQRSMVDFHYDDDSRYANWKKAKRFISAFKPKSNETTRKRIVKSSSTGALSHVAGLANDSSSDSEWDRAPALSMALSHNAFTSQQYNNKREGEPPDGLVRPRDADMFHSGVSGIQPAAAVVVQSRPRGVGAVLARRLASSVRGSFSKYDGERATHHYQSEDKSECKDPLDGIDSAVNRGQERLKQSDRRSSNVSFNKTNMIQVASKMNGLAAAAAMPPPQSQKSVREELARLAASGGGRALLQHLTSPRNSASLSETNTLRSSNDSLSSDARSKISFKKRSSSPPRITAPPPRREPSSTTLTMQPASSIDSLNSQQTRRSHSPLLLPIHRNNLRTSSNSGSDRCIDYCEVAVERMPAEVSSVASQMEYVTIDAVGTRAAREASNQQRHRSFERQRSNSSSLQGMESTRRRSQASSASDSLSVGQPTTSKHGFLKKYKKMRRKREEEEDTSRSLGHLHF